MKFNELRFTIVPFSNAGYKVNWKLTVVYFLYAIRYVLYAIKLPGLRGGIFNRHSRIGVDSYLEPGGAGITFFIFMC